MTMTDIYKIINGVSPGNYGMTVGEFNAIHQKTNGKTFDSMYDAFLYGFVKGQRAEKARQRKVRVKKCNK